MDLEYQPDRIDLLAATIAKNHVDTIERLTRLETSLFGVPQRVEALERRNQKLAGALKALSVIFGVISTVLGFIFKFRH